MTENRIPAGRYILRAAFLAALFILIFNVKNVHAAENYTTERHGYYYQFLDSSEKNAYDAILESCEDRTDYFEFTPMQLEQFWNAWDAARLDHPEYYWLHYGITSYKNSKNLTYRAYNNIPYDANINLTVMDAIAENTAMNIRYSNEYEKYRYIYEFIKEKVTYGKETGVDDQSITGALMENKAVCSGYADAFKYLCDKAGLFCIKVLGKTLDGDPNGHSWNMIRVDGSYYWVDVTWGDETARKSQMAYGDLNSYVYLCMTDALFLKDHFISPNCLNTYAGHFQATYPACTNNQYTYYSLMDLQFSCVEDAYNYIQSNISSGIPYVRMQFDTTEEMYRALEVLHTNNTMWDIVNNSGIYYDNYQYWYNDILNTLVFEFH